jgi:hypothetical protein
MTSACGVGEFGGGWGEDWSESASPLPKFFVNLCGLLTKKLGEGVDWDFALQRRFPAFLASSKNCPPGPVLTGTRSVRFDFPPTR